MKTGPTSLTRWLFACIPLFATATTHAQDRESLLDFINAYRAAPGRCEGRPADPVPPLAPHSALARVHVTPGVSLEQALERAGYPVAQAKGLYISGAPDAGAAMDAIARSSCRSLLSTQFSAVGAERNGDSWFVVLARPAAPVARLPDARRTGKMILDAVNKARATDRYCGERAFTAVPALSWNPALANAAAVHSLDMARQRNFSHQGTDGSEVADRVVQAGYRWRGVGENIAAGQASPEEAVAGWLASPGHCANIMDRSFKDMGAAYALGGAREKPHVYWTQVFGVAR
jgi:uncharacterized protein YkwD